MIDYKKIIALILCFSALILCSCSTNTYKKSESGKLKVIATIFPQYDFVRSIAGDNVELKMLLSPGKESHTYDPSARDIFDINNCDIFIYVGGESDEWAKTVLSSAENENMSVISLMDCVKLYKEEQVNELVQEDAEDEYDEHVWTSPENAKLIISKICDVLCEKDEKNAETYRKNTETYISEIQKLDNDIRTEVNSAKRKFIVMADRFPIRYFTESYGIDYCAAFPGCSLKTEPSPTITSFIIEKVKTENIPVIFKIELSDGYIANAVAEATGAKVMTFNSCHNITKDDFDAGATYISLMKENLDALKIALN